MAALAPATDRSDRDLLLISLRRQLFFAFRQLAIRLLLSELTEVGDALLAQRRLLRGCPRRGRGQILRAMASRIPFAHTVVMFRKAAWRQAGGYPLVDKLVDYRLWIAIGALGWRFANLPVALGEHLIYPESYWNRTFGYRASQLELARSQALAISALGLPFWTRVYPLGRYVYWSLPDGLKRLARRLLAGSLERDVLSG